MRRPVKVQGNIDPLFLIGYCCSVGYISGGLGFEFGSHGSFVIDIEDLKAIIAEAEANRAGDGGGDED